MNLGGFYLVNHLKQLYSTFQVFAFTACKQFKVRISVAVVIPKMKIIANYQEFRAKDIDFYAEMLYLVGFYHVVIKNCL